MASEDSDQVLPGRSPVHRFRDLGDLNETVAFAAPTAVDQAHAARELFEVALLARPEGVPFEERNYRLEQLPPAVDDELAQVLAVVVVSLGGVDPPDTKEAT